MNAKRYDVELMPVEATEEHLLTPNGHYKNSTINMNQVLDSDLLKNIFTPSNSKEES